MPEDINVLVVCTAGKHRSPTAARLLRDEFGFPARPAGIHPQARQSVTRELIDWADHIIAMDERTDGHKSYLEDRFDLDNRPVYVFDIPDVYGRGDPELVELLTDKLSAFVDHVADNKSR